MANYIQGYLLIPDGTVWVLPWCLSSLDIPWPSGYSLQRDVGKGKLSSFHCGAVYVTIVDGFFDILPWVRVNSDAQIWLKLRHIWMELHLNVASNCHHRHYGLEFH
jgi:hypothetical protein